jgi:hypothetical protein
LQPPTSVKVRLDVFGVVDPQQMDALRSTPRQFIQDRPLATNLPAPMSSRTFPANIRLTWDQVDLLAPQRPAGRPRAGRQRPHRQLLGGRLQPAGQRLQARWPGRRKRLQLRRPAGHRDLPRLRKARLPRPQPRCSSTLTTSSLPKG